MPACVASATRGTLPQRATCHRLVAVPLVGCGRPGVLCRGQRGLVQQAAALGELLLAIAIGQEAVVADAVEAWREHVQQNAPDELGRVHRHGLLAGRAGAAVVGVAEAHGAAVAAAQALVADGDPVRVAAEVVEDLFGAGEGSLRIDDPLGLAGRAEVLGEARWVAERLQPAGEVELSGLECVLQRREEHPPEVAGQDPNRQEEPGAAGNPGAPVVGEPPTRNDAVQMGMMHERLAPGMEDREEAELGAEVARVGSDRAERVCDGPEEQTLDDGLVLCGDLGDSRGHGEDDVEVLDRQQVGPASFEPVGAGQRVTGR